MEQASKIFEEMLENIDASMHKVVEIAPKDNALIATLIKMANNKGAELAKILANLAALLERPKFTEKKDKEMKEWMDNQMKKGTPIEEMYAKFKIKCAALMLF